MAFHERTGMKTRGSPGVLPPKFPTLLTFSPLRFLSFERRPVLLLSPSTPAKSFAWFALAIAADVTGFLVRKEANNHPPRTNCCRRSNGDGFLPMCQGQVLSMLWFDVLLVWYTYVLTCALYVYTSLHLCERISDVAGPCIHRTGDDPSSNTVAGVATTETRLCVRISSDPSYRIFEFIDSLSVSLFFSFYLTLSLLRFRVSSLSVPSCFRPLFSSWHGNESDLLVTCATSRYFDVGTVVLLMLVRKSPPLTMQIK